MTEDAPTHILTHGGETHTMCGIRLKEPTALPYLCAAHVPAHIKGRGVVLCKDCAASYHWLLDKVGGPC
jgi:hypothetical protein